MELMLEVGLAQLPQLRELASHPNKNPVLGLSYSYSKSIYLIFIVFIKNIYATTANYKHCQANACQ
jgi:hypothetical protein